MLTNERIYRRTLRGLRKCPSCQHYNGNRAKGCINKNCSLHFLKKLKKKNHLTIDPIQLVTYTNAKIYSVRNKEREPLQRNFVQILDKTLSAAQNDGSTIISRNAICFVDTCKYDANDVNLSCKHVKSATTECQMLAQEIKITKPILYGMKINDELKSQLWSLYCSNELIVPPVQRINKSMFVIKCNQNVNFPAGRLHLMVKSDADGDFDYMCSCKKPVQIFLSSSKNHHHHTAVILENDVCDHILMLLAGILSSAEHVQNQFQNMLNAMKSFWNDVSNSPSKLFKQNDFDDDAFDSDFISNGDLYNFAEGILNSVIELDSNDESSLPQKILQNDNNLYSSSNSSNCSDRSNNSTNYNGQLQHIYSTSNEIFQQNNTDMEIELVEMPFNSEVAGAVTAELAAAEVDTITTATAITNSSIQNEYLELADCQIELMDQFKLTDQIDLCNNDDVLLNLNDDDLQYLQQQRQDEEEIEGNGNLSKTATERKQNIRKQQQQKYNNSSTKCNNCDNHVNVKTNNSKNNDRNSKTKAIFITSPNTAVLEFNEWMEFVIEQINMSIEANAKNTNIKHNFNIKNNFFEYLSEKFTINGKRRIPNTTVIIRKGQFKGLTQSKWIFLIPTTVQRIFSTAESSIQLERHFMENPDGTFKLFDCVEEMKNDCSSIDIKDNQKKYKKILPNLFCAFIKFDSKGKDQHSTGFTIEWIPNVFSKSQFGIMKIEFTIGVRKCNQTS